MRVWGCIDGFNLYNGLLKGSPHRWLDLHALCQSILKQGEYVENVKFFTAQVVNTPDDPDVQKRQRIYWRALRAVGGVEIIEGRFRSHPRHMPTEDSLRRIEVAKAAGASTKGMRVEFVEVRRREEKGTDVNLAAHLVHDAHLRRFETALVVSDDSDLHEAIRLVRSEVGKPVVVASPHPERPSVRLKKVSSRFIVLDETMLGGHLLPSPLNDAHGEFDKPATW